jgi:hypothetical protein
MPASSSTTISDTAGMLFPQLQLVLSLLQLLTTWNDVKLFMQATPVHVGMLQIKFKEGIGNFTLLSSSDVMIIFCMKQSIARSVIKFYINEVIFWHNIGHGDVGKGVLFETRLKPGKDLWIFSSTSSSGSTSMCGSRV